MGESWREAGKILEDKKKEKSILSKFKIDESLDTYKQSALDQMNKILSEYITKVLLHLILYTRLEFPEFASDDFIIFTLCKKIANDGSFSNDYTSDVRRLIEDITNYKKNNGNNWFNKMNAFNIDDKIFTSYNTDYEQYLIAAFGGKIPDKSRSLIDADAVLEDVKQRSISYGDNYTSPYYIKAGKTYYIKPTDYNKIEPHLNILYYAYGYTVRIPESRAKKLRVE